MDMDFSWWEFLWGVVGFLVIPVTGLLLYASFKIIVKLRLQRAYRQFNNTERDKVVLHVFPQLSLPLPTIVPWDLKLEMFFRIAKINYEKDGLYPFGPKGKTPWISFNGVHMGDSHFIIQYLKQHFGVDFNKSYPEEQLAVARSVRVMLEERWYWAMVIWRWLRKNGEGQFYKDFSRIEKDSPLGVMRIYFRHVLRNAVNGHGIGRHTEEEIMQLHLADLKTVSLVLGNKKYICGDEPCEEDFGIFGQLCQAVWGLPNSPHEKFIEEEAPNLKEYVTRIRNQLWTEAERETLWTPYVPGKAK